MRTRTALAVLALAVPVSGCSFPAAYSVFMIGTFAHVDEQSRHDRSNYLNPYISLDPTTPRAVPPMDEARKVNLQDCSKPVVDSSANLSCR